eukprot:8526563-Pyramimonas_sp.AAC.1
MFKHFLVESGCSVLQWFAELGRDVRNAVEPVGDVCFSFPARKGEGVVAHVSPLLLGRAPLHITEVLRDLASASGLVAFHARFAPHLPVSLVPGLV